MRKSLVAQEYSISKIFSDDFVFYIPGYQRPYAWTIEEARELFDDLMSSMNSDSGPIENMQPYFLGSIVLIKNDTSPSADVVDGQQRLTTLTILLAAIRAAISGSLSAEVTQLLYEKGSMIQNTQDRFRLTLREKDKEFFQSYIQREDGFNQLLKLNDRLSDSQNNIRTNAKHYAERLACISEDDRIRLAQYIVTRCFLVVVATPDLDSAYRIFSVLNSRGLDLSATDILKAQIIGAIPAQKRDHYTSIWEDTEEDLTRKVFGELFSHIRMIYRKSKPMGTLLKEFNDHVSVVKQPMVFIDTVLIPMSRAYEEILDSAYESTGDTADINEHLKWLNRLEFSDWIPPALVYSTKQRQEPDLVLRFFSDLERLAYAMLIMKYGINERIDRFSKLTERIDSGADLYCDESPLQLSLKEQNNVYEKLNGPIYESLSTRARSSLLLRLDALLSGGGATYEYSTVTVEHILPQNPPDKSKWLEWVPDSDARLFWVHRLGNLALLTRKKNSSASNYEFDTKKTAYFTKNGISPFVLTTQVLDKPEWTLDVLLSRQNELLSIFAKHWRLSPIRPSV